MKKSRRPKKKEEQPKSKTKKNKKKVGQQKKPQDECSGSNPSAAEADDGRNQIMINVPPPPRFSEVRRKHWKCSKKYVCSKYYLIDR